MPQLSQVTIDLLNDIESRIAPDVEEDFARQWDDFLNNRFTGDIFSPNRTILSAPSVKVPAVNINDAIGDYEMMLLYELRGVSNALNSRTQNLCVRSNYGTGILSSLFGAEIFEMPREMNTLPTTRAIGDTEEIRRISESGIPDLMGGFGRRVFEFGEYCLEVFRQYPKIQKYVTIYHPDTQGPLDICELLWGSEMFYALYEEPELMHAMMTLLTDTYTAFLQEWYKIVPMNTGVNVHWTHIRHKGAIMLRDDSAMNLSPALYAEFAAPYDGELLKRFGGGAVHFCGRGDHYIETLTSLPGLTGINLSQPHLNDMERIYRNTVDRGIKILGFSREWAQKDKSRGYRSNLSV